MNNRDLVEMLVEEGVLRTPHIIDAFLKIDRADFVPATLMNEAYGNYPLLLGFGQTISQPYTVAFMMELLNPQIGHAILDVGSGSGWTTALLAHIVGQTGQVIAIERIPELFTLSQQNLKKYNSITEKVVRGFCGNGAAGKKEYAPFDRISAAAALQEIPRAWKKQLKIGGRIVAPVGSKITVLDKKSEDYFEQRDYPGFSFVPFIS